MPLSSSPSSATHSSPPELVGNVPAQFIRHVLVALRHAGDPLSEPCVARQPPSVTYSLQAR